MKESTQLAAAAAWLEQQATQQKLKCETNRKTNLEGDAANVQAAALGSSWEQACNMVEFKIGCTKSERLVRAMLMLLLLLLLHPRILYSIVLLQAL